MLGCLKKATTMNERNIRRFERATRVQTFGREHAADFATQGSVGVLARLPMRRERTSKSRHPVFPRSGTAPAQAPSSSCVLRLAVLRLSTAYELPADFVTDLRADRDAPAASPRPSQPILGLVSCVLQSCVFPITRLDAAVKNKYARDPEKLAAWKSASHTVKSEKRLQPPEKPTPPAP